MRLGRLVPAAAVALAAGLMAVPAFAAVEGKVKGYGFEEQVFSGRLKSDGTKKCIKVRPVRIIQTYLGEKRDVGLANTDARGRFRIAVPSPPAAADYRAKAATVKVRKGGRKLTCKTLRSKKITFARD